MPTIEALGNSYDLCGQPKKESLRITMDKTCIHSNRKDIVLL